MLEAAESSYLKSTNDHRRRILANPPCRNGALTAVALARRHPLRLGDGSCDLSIGASATGEAAQRSRASSSTSVRTSGAAEYLPRRPRGNEKRVARPESSYKRLHTYRTLEFLQINLKTKALIYRAFAEPSDGLEPSTSSLPCRLGGKRWQPVAKDRAVSSGLSSPSGLDRLLAVATAGLHRGSIRLDGPAWIRASPAAFQFWASVRWRGG
jgi:hypothetical protein